MVRFCDKEICCVTENEMDWQLMSDYFLDWDINEKIYILDKDGRFVGNVVYNALFGIEPDNAVRKELVNLGENRNVWIVKDYVTLDKHVLENGRNYFISCPDGLLPVVNEERQLVCFAWNDKEADRELRMLDELAGGGKNQWTFQDIYPQAGCVTVNGFHELAYYFVRYLEKMDVPVRVTGEFWDMFDINMGPEVPDYMNFVIDAEGNTGLQGEKDRLCRSVSAEFECVDRIYEENIINGLINDADTGFEEFIERVKGKQTVILGTGEDSINAYDLLLGHGVDICCFMEEDTKKPGKIQFGKKPVLGKEVKSREEVLKEIQSPVFVSASGRYSAWGFGGTDMFHYMGFKRNERFFLLQDYAEIPDNGWQNILKHAVKRQKRRIVLIGDFWLCLKLCRSLEMLDESIKGMAGYCDVLEEHEEERGRMLWIGENEVSVSDVCLLLIPEYVGCTAEDDAAGDSYRKIVKQMYIKQAEKYNVYNVSDYPLENILFMNGYKETENKDNLGIRIKQVVLGSILSYSGNIFFRDILDSHPEILMIEHSYLNDNLFYICTRLAMEKRENILSLFWQIYDAEASHYKSGENAFGKAEKKIFNESMKEMLSKKEIFTSQELFILLHAAYGKIWEKGTIDVSKMMVYWEPHFISRKKLEDYAIWLKNTGLVQGSIVNVVRNTYIRRGSAIKGVKGYGQDMPGVNRHIFSYAFSGLNEEKRVYDNWHRIVIKFEDLKCRPKEVLLYICRVFGIAWSDILLETTLHGKPREGDIMGFNLAPVYRLYEEYFSAFDRFRLMLAAGLWQKEHGYPYVSILDFNRKELQSMFEKEFRFEENLEYQYEGEAQELNRWKQDILSRSLWEVRRGEVMAMLSSG